MNNKNYRLKMSFILILFFLALVACGITETKQKMMHKDVILKEAVVENHVERNAVPNPVTDGNPEVHQVDEPQIIHESSKEIVYENDIIKCVEEYDYINDPMGSHPIISVVHHTYNKGSGEELSLMDVTGMDADDVADEIRRQLKDKFPDLYNSYWGNEDDIYGSYREYFFSIDPGKLDFCLKEGGKVEVYDTWMLDHATNPNGVTVYVTLDSSY